MGKTLNAKELLRKGGRYLLAFSAVSFVAGYITFKVLSSGLTVEVPDLTGRSLGQATASLEDIGLTLKVGSEAYDISVPEGHVISQDMPPGTNIRGQAEVVVLLSKGQEVRLIPSFVGMSTEDAKKIMLKERLQLDRVITVHSDTIEKGNIIAQRPAPDEWTGEGITLVASEGPYNVIYYCPFFQGMIKDDALLLAAELGLSVELRETEGTRVVIDQNPPPGAEIKLGETVRLMLGEG